MRTGTREDYLTQIKEAVNENFPGEGDEEDEDFITEIPEKDKRKSLTKHGFFSNYMAVELLMGILAYYVICEIVLLIIGKKLLYNSIGLFLGIAICVLMLISISRSIERTLSYNSEDQAESYLKRSTIIRLGISLVILVIVAFTNIGNIITLLVGVMALKVSAYLQPFTDKLYFRLTKNMDLPEENN